MLRTNKKFLSVITAALMSVSLATTSLVSTASAAGAGVTVPDGSIFSFTKDLIISKPDATVPNVDFTFTISEPEPSTIGGSIKSGVMSDSFSSASVSFTESDTITDGKVSKPVEIDFSDLLTSISSPGTYRYKILEDIRTASDGKGNYAAGIINDTVLNRYLDVYVEQDSGNLKIAYFVLNAPVDGGTSEKSEGYKNKYDIRNLTINTAVTGSAGDINDSFTYTVTLEGTEGAHITTTDNVSVEGNVYTATLKHNETATIYNIPRGSGSTWTIGQSLPQGYTSNKTEDTDATTGDVTMNFTYNKDGTIPTGVSLNIIIPAIICVTFIGGVAALIVIKKKDRDEDKE